MPGLGDEFRAAREARHLSLSDVSDQIHIRAVYLESIEAEDPTFAAPVYVRGFVRTYARFLGLNPEAAIAQFRVGTTEAPYRAGDPVRVSANGGRRGPSPWLWIAGVAATLLVAFVGYKYFEFQQTGSPAPAAVVGIASPAAASVSASPAPQTEPSLAPAKPVVVKDTLEVRVTQDSWMSVKIDGLSRLEGLVKAGTTKAFHGKSAQVRAGNAGGVTLAVNGKELGKMGNVGDVVERSLALVPQ